MIKKILLDFLNFNFFKKDKEFHEYRYWKSRKNVEGNLLNNHYQRFYTDFFDIPKSFYADKRILDIGCGPRGSLEWADCARERVGLDPLAHKYRNLGTEHHQMQYITGHAEAIPYPECYFDVVMSFNSLDHVSSVEQTIIEIGRVTATGGYFLLLTDVNHDPTPTEPNHFGWEIVEEFMPFFRIINERHYEKGAGGMYQSIETGLLYDHTNLLKRYGVLAAMFQKI